MKKFRFSGVREAGILLSLVAVFILLGKASTEAIESSAFVTINILRAFIVTCGMHLGILPWPYPKYQKTIGCVIYLSITTAILVLESWMKAMNQTAGLEYVIFCRAILSSFSLLVIHQQTFSLTKPTPKYATTLVGSVLYISGLMPMISSISMFSQKFTETMVLSYAIQGSIILIIMIFVIRADYKNKRAMNQV